LSRIAGERDISTSLNTKQKKPGDGKRGAEDARQRRRTNRHNDGLRLSTRYASTNLTKEKIDKLLEQGKQKERELLDLSSAYAGSRSGIQI